MFFLLRAAFWLCVVSIFLPVGSYQSSDGPSAQDRASIDALTALAAAGATVQDMSGFCARQPDACAVGQQAIKMVGARAMDGAAAVQSYMSSQQAPKAAVEKTAAPATTASVAAPGARDTLNSSDKKPAWRAPGAAGRPV